MSLIRRKFPLHDNDWRHKEEDSRGFNRLEYQGPYQRDPSFRNFHRHGQRNLQRREEFRRANLQYLTKKSERNHLEGSWWYERNKTNLSHPLDKSFRWHKNNVSSLINYQSSSNFLKPSFRSRATKRTFEDFYLKSIFEPDKKYRKLDGGGKKYRSSFLRRFDLIMMERKEERATLLEELNADLLKNLEAVVDEIYMEAHQTYYLTDLDDNISSFCKRFRKSSGYRILGNNEEICKFETLLVEKITNEFDKFAKLHLHVAMLANRNKSASKEKKNTWIQKGYAQYMPVIRTQVYGSFKLIKFLFCNNMMSTEQVNCLMKTLIDLPEERNLECLKKFIEFMGHEHQFQVDEQVADHPNPKFVELYNLVRAMASDPNYEGNQQCILANIVKINTSRVQKNK